MLTFIIVALGLLVGLIMAGIATIIVVSNPTIVGWTLDKYVSAVEKKYEKPQG